MSSTNFHVGGGGGNQSHKFRVFAKDSYGRFETPSRVPGDREIYEFWYNFPPTSEILYPQEGDTVCPDFTVVWSGVDPDGEVVAYQYVLDPRINSYREQEGTEKPYEDIPPGEHEFRVAARDNSNCWQKGYKEVHFVVEECK
jgi:hypothetical protein